MAKTPLRTVPDLTGLLNHAGHVLETQLTAALAEIGLTPRMQCVLLHALGEERTQIQLAELAYLDKTTMVVTVDALEKAGFAERKPSASDRRARIIAVTGAGAEIVAEGQRIVDKVHADVLAALAAAQRKPFTEALTTLVEGHLATPVEAQSVRRTRQRAS
ncbi:DNA-binding MarR family transcriptional regulator [Kribbella voronezhensis]|uniref:DNA-binding MarR family transcriptional regulator n=1 Tax=Kribbella voronezhensis TaxID=2512212 RepID=A0A4R7STZ1_9ACTN|nr:MarR family transcriptional regulator [Kribbella voronezhensis]TDU82209.1 DNA-binding MarR family transcriptional regulator [Kribbella voronezhensis]